MLTRDEIRAGDVVRLRNGETITVYGTTESYSDRDGTYPGPWVIEARTHARFLVADCLEVAERNERSCVLCGEGCTAKDPERYPYCRNCHYTGAASSHIRAQQVERFVAASGAATVNVEHTGGGCFWMAFHFEGDAYYYAATNGEASLPTDAEGEPLAEGGWGVVCRYPYDEENEAEYDGVVILAGSDPETQSSGWTSSRYWDEYPKHSRSDDEVVAAILADRKSREETV